MPRRSPDQSSGAVLRALPWAWIGGAMGLAAFIAAAERLLVRIRRVSGNRVAYQLRISPAQSRFKARPVRRLGFLKISTGSSIVLLLGAAQPDPPGIASGINAFGARLRKLVAHLVGGMLRAGLYKHHAAPLAQSVFIDVDLVLGKPVHPLFDGGPTRGPCHGADRTE